MIYAAVLAGGKGTRMGNTDLPKQFLMLGEKPIIIHTIEQFMLVSEIDKIIVCCPKVWIAHMEDLLKKYIPESIDVCVVEGGETRNETIINACKFIDKNFCLKDDDVIITHDAVRPFVSTKLIKDNIAAIKSADAVDTVIEAVDTIVESKDGDVIKSIPDRKMMYQGQTPQTFKIKKLMKLYKELTNEEKEILTDACKIFVLKGSKVKMVNGDEFNMKITKLHDLKVARAILLERGNK